MQPPFQPDDTLKLKIEGLAYGGNGVAHPQGFAIFVPRTAPGDEVLVKVISMKRRFGRAIPLKIVTPSSYRIEPRCPHFDSCGGCHYQHLDPPFVAQQKVTLIKECFHRIGQSLVNVRPLISPTKQWNYRNRLTYHRSITGEAGYISWKDFKVIDVEECPISTEELNEVWKKIRVVLKQISPNILPFVVLRRTMQGQSAVILSVVEMDDLPQFKEQLKIILRPLNSNVYFYLSLIPSGSRVALGKTIVSLLGPEFMKEQIAGIEYFIRPDLFFQVHPEVTDQIVHNVVAWAKGHKVIRAVDIYCGAGLFTLALAKQEIHVLGIDVQYPAIQCAQTSAKKNSLETFARFRTGKAERMIERIIREGERFDTALVDPPRKGLHPKLLESLPRLGVNRLLYISCSPPTLARDARELQKLGYSIQWVQPYDMFPQTYHVETITFFHRRI